MIKLLRKGIYRLGDTRRHSRFLYLDDECYLWLHVKSIGDILALAASKHDLHYILSEGTYAIYDIQNEPDIVDLQHLELEINKDHWQSYLLLTGLPTKAKKRSRIIPTTEKVADYIKENFDSRTTTFKETAA